MLRSSNDDSRTARFTDRVNLERAILMDINLSPLGNRHSLAGLTADAIEQWLNTLGADGSVDPGRLVLIALGLRKVSIEVGLMVENSCAVFDDEGLGHTGPSRAAVLTLRDLLSK